MVPIYTCLAEIERPTLKTPNSKNQAPMKLQYSKYKSASRPASARPWCLVFLWSLVFGAWSFTARAADTNAVISTWIAAQANIHTFSADVVQTRTFKSLAQPLTA